jgi:aspartate/methionine/tyrosine aminotransferase
MIAPARRLTGVELSSTATTADAAPAIDDVLDLAGGELREPAPPVALEAAIGAVRDVALHRYGPVGGLPALRSAVAERLSADGSRSIGADQVLITSGTKQSLFHAMLAFVGAGDEVLVPAPYWPSHPAMIRLGSGVPVVVAAGSEHEFKVTPDLLDAAVSPRTRYLVFVNPANPTGTVYTPTEVEALGRWARRRGVVVISDEIYAGLTHASTEPTPICRAVPALASSGLRVGGVSKTYAMTGWRIGWLAGPLGRSRPPPPCNRTPRRIRRMSRRQQRSPSWRTGLPRGWPTCG